MQTFVFSFLVLILYASCLPENKNSSDAGLSNSESRDASHSNSNQNHQTDSGVQNDSGLDKPDGGSVVLNSEADAVYFDCRKEWIHRPYGGNQEATDLCDPCTPCEKGRCVHGHCAELGENDFQIVSVSSENPVHPPNDSAGADGFVVNVGSPLKIRVEVKTRLGPVSEIESELFDASGASYGAFVLAGGAYYFDLPWNVLEQVHPLESAPRRGALRRFQGVFRHKGKVASFELLVNIRCDAWNAKYTRTKDSGFCATEMASTWDEDLDFGTLLRCGSELCKVVDGTTTSICSVDTGDKCVDLSYESGDNFGNLYLSEFRSNREHSVVLMLGANYYGDPTRWYVTRAVNGIWDGEVRLLYDVDRLGNQRGVYLDNNGETYVMLANSEYNKTELEIWNYSVSGVEKKILRRDRSLSGDYNLHTHHGLTSDGNGALFWLERSDFGVYALMRYRVGIDKEATEKIIVSKSEYFYSDTYEHGIVFDSERNVLILAIEGDGNEVTTFEIDPSTLDVKRRLNFNPGDVTGFAFHALPNSSNGTDIYMMAGFDDGFELYRFDRNFEQGWRLWALGADNLMVKDDETIFNKEQVLENSVDFEFDASQKLHLLWKMGKRYNIRSDFGRFGYHAVVPFNP